MLLSCDFVLDEITEDSINAISSEKIELLNNYMLNGGNATLKALRNLPKNTQQDILDIFVTVRFTKRLPQTKKILFLFIPVLITSIKAKNQRLLIR